MWSDALPNLLIALREGLEAGLVVSILLATVRRTGIAHRAGSVWLGVAAAVVLALSFGAVLTFYRSVLPPTAQEALSGVLSVVAVGLVTWMIFWMRRTARSLPGELRAKVAAALEISTAALALTAFVAVAREGLETALFLWTAAQTTGQTVAPLIGAAIGLAVAIGLCVALYRGAVRIRLSVFFNRTAILLIVIAAGVLAYGLGDLQEAGLLPGHSWHAFDLSAHIDPASWWVTLVTGVTTLSPVMTWLQVAAYVGYLAVVLTVFSRATHQPVRQPTSGAKQPPPAATAESPSHPWLQRRVMVAGVVAALVLPPLIAATLILLAPGKAAAADQRIDVTDTACAPGWSNASAGLHTFTVVNKSSHTAEVTLIQAANQGIIAEIETLAPGTRSALPATLAADDYAWRCLISGQPAMTSHPVRATGTAGGVASPPVVQPVSADDLRPAVTAYRAYVAPQLARLSTQVDQLRADLAAGRLDTARSDWLPAQLTWERVGAAYGSFGDLGGAIDGLPNGLPGGVNDPGFTGLHRLEYGLWHGQQPDQLLPVVDTLTANVAKLRDTLPQATFDPADLPLRAHEILEDALRDHLTGMTDQGSGASYQETLADVEGTRVVVGELAPLLNARRPGLVPTATRQLDALEQALLATPVNGQWPSLNATPVAARQRVNAATGVVVETLADIPDLLEMPAH